MEMTAQQLYDELKRLIDNKNIPNGELIIYRTFVHYAPNIEIEHLPKLTNHDYYLFK